MTNCLNVLSRGSCTVPNCAHEHNILVCEPCGFIADDANAYTGHLTSNRHKTRIAGRGITLYCPVCEMNIESGTWASHKAGSNHLNQAIRKRVAPDVDPEEGVNDQGQKYCQLCKRAVRNSEWARHLRGTWHLKRKDFAAYQAALNEAERDKNGISIDGKLDFGIVDFTKTKKTITRPIVLKATAANVRVRLTDSKLVSSRANMDTAFTVAPEGNNRNISSGTSVNLFVTLKQTYIGRYEDRLEMSFQDLQTKKKFFISRALRVIIGSKEGHEQLKASKPYVPRSSAPKKAERKIIRGIKPPALTSIPYVKKLKPALIPKRLQDAVSNGSTAEIIERIRSDFLPPTLNSQSLPRHFKTLLWVEEHRAQQDLERYDIPDARLKKGGPFYFVEVPGLAEKRPSVLLGDRILVQPHGAPEGLWFEGYVHIVREKEVGLRFNKSFKTSQLYHVRFKLFRINFRRQHNALDENFHEDRILFPNVTHSSALSRERGASKGKSRYYDHNIATNSQQELAIRSITRLPPGSPPFVLFGPFGTGKTSTIIEAILQILKSDTEARILACAPSNAAADLIATKLSTILNNQVLFRYNAPSRSIKGISTEVLKHSHFVQADDSQPSHFGVPSDKIKRFRVIVSTCISSSFADGIGIPRGHFSHIFIDEAGQATEPETLVSIKTLADSRTNIILTGDPKQLGPVIQSPIARQLGLQISYLERLMEREVYNVENFSGVTVVKLLNNYRCHPAILKVPNEQFYNGELKAKANPEKVNKYLGSPILPNVKLPIIFHAVLGKDEKEASSPSYFNVDEALQVKQYVQMLQTAKRYHTSEKDIGIIALYHAQCLKIRKALHGIAEEIKVGSVEEFQGQERSVIIMSTVRSSEKFIEFDIRHQLGFVANPRKFNVAITRSQALLIIVGNPRVLSIDPMWRYFLNYVYNNGGWRGPVPDWDMNAEVDLSGGYDKAMHQQAQLDMNEFTRRMESLTMGGIDEDGAGVHLREE